MSDINRLLLYPEVADLPVDIVARTREVLQESKFVGEKIPLSLDDHFVGDRFLDHMTFMGCSPAISLSPEDGDDYCFIRVGELRNDYYLYSGSNTQVPHCKQCKTKKDNWSQLKQDESICDQCSTEDQASNLVWRRTAAMARFVIQVMHIYPHEAIPSPEIMLQLEEVSRIGWKHAYLQAEC